MNEQHADRQATSGGAVHERCLCCEIMSHLRDCLGVSPAVQQHLTNSSQQFFHLPDCTRSLPARTAALSTAKRRVIERVAA